MKDRPAFRPQLVDIVGWREGKPEMVLCFPGRPSLYVTVKVKGSARSLREIRISANEQIAAMDRQAVQLLRETAKPGPAWTHNPYGEAIGD